MNENFEKTLRELDIPASLHERCAMGARSAARAQRTVRLRQLTVAAAASGAAGAGAVTKLVAKDRSVIKRAAMPKYPYEYLSTETYDRVSSERDELISSFAEEYL